MSKEFLILSRNHAFLTKKNMTFYRNFGDGTTTVLAKAGLYDYEEDTAYKQIDVLFFVKKEIVDALAVGGKVPNTPENLEKLIGISANKRTEECFVVVASGAFLMFYKTPFMGTTADPNEAKVYFELPSFSDPAQCFLIEKDTALKLAEPCGNSHRLRNTVANLSALGIDTNLAYTV